MPEPAEVIRALRSTAYAAQVRELAAAVRTHDFPLLGIRIMTEREIRWRKDYVSGIESRLAYFRRIPYLDAEHVGDHKVIWELNRHQHFIVLAQDFRLHGSRESLDELIAQFESWVAQNPFQRGINWVSALEVALRSLSWLWVWHLAGEAISDSVRRVLLRQLHLHGTYIANNLSHYFAPNTHLLGEAVALYTLGVLFDFPESTQWAKMGSQVVEQEFDRQMRDDGSHFEQSTYYQLYALDMFLFYAILSQPGGLFREKLGRAADFLAGLMGVQQELPFIGDDDGGRFFHPYGNPARYGRATLATCAEFLTDGRWQAKDEDLAVQAAWWLGKTHRSHDVNGAQRSRLFRDAGLAVMCSGQLQSIIDVGPFGRAPAGHSHSDTLSCIVRDGGEPILIDPGTYTYVGDRKWRDYFRGSAAHNTVRIDEANQAVVAGPFGWTALPDVSLIEWESQNDHDFVTAECRYGGLVHRRTVLFVKTGALFIKDEISGALGEHLIEQFWQTPKGGDHGRFRFSEQFELTDGWWSPAFGRKEPSTVIRVAARRSLPYRLGAAIAMRPGSLELSRQGTKFQFAWTPSEGQRCHWLM